MSMQGEDFLTVSTQTEWSWLQDLDMVGRHSIPEPYTTAEEDECSPTLPEDGVKSEKIINENAEISAENETEAVNNESEAPITENNYNVDTVEIASSNEKEADVTEVHTPVQVLGDPMDDMSLYDSDSASSSNESFYDENDLFPSIGPPQMLEFLRETNSGKFVNDLNKSDSMSFDAERGFHKSFFSGPCQFCGERVLPLPTVQEIETLPSNKLFCCGQYEEFVKLYITYVDKKKVEKEVIDIKPHAPYGSKAARKAAKERAAERMREKEIEKQKVATAQANFFSFARQVKTIQYSLSSQKCMQDGWTVRPTTPKIEAVKQEDGDFSIEVNTSLLQKKNELYEKFYDNGNRFVVIFPDGTGCCYYPSGNVAVIINSYEKGKFNYILQKDSDDYDTEDPGILGIFEPSGKASCYFKDGSIRLMLTPQNGMQLDKHGNYKKRWQWHFIKGHVHTPPFQPICFALNKQMSCRVMEQDHIVITFTSDQRTVRFNVGAKLKAIKQTMPPVVKNDEHELFMNSIKKKVQNIQEKIQLIMRFPKSPKLDVLISKTQQERSNRSGQNGKLQLPKLKGKEPSVIVN